MNCTIPKGSYAGWGWGKNMDNTEMVIFEAPTDPTALPDVTTYYSKGKDTPIAEPEMQACYTSTITDLGNGSLQFITTRPLDCGVSNSYVVKLDSKM